MIVQVYGITTVADARMVAELGADHVGIVPEHRGNWDGVEVDVANAIVDALPEHVAAVVLSLGTTVHDVVATARAAPGDWLHVVRTDVLGADGLRAIRDATGARLMATVAIDGPEAVGRAHALSAQADALLLDSRDPASAVVGASGHTHDWSVSAAVVAAVVPAPVILAGGLGPDNVHDAIAQVAPWGVDSETRTSTDADRRRKDPDRVQRFVENARRATTRS